MTNISPEEAASYFDKLPDECRVATLHPRYVVADAARDQTLKPSFFLFISGDDFFLNGVHMAQVPGTDCCDIQSPYGYGGPLSTSDDASFLAEAWHAYLEWCRTHHVIAEFQRFHPMVRNDRFYSGTAQDDRQIVWVDLGVADFMQEYRGRQRTAIRSAIRRGVAFRWLDVDAARSFFPEFYRAAMADIGAADFYRFPDAYFEAVLELPTSRVGVCTLAGEVLSAGIFLFGPHAVEYHLSANRPAARETNSNAYMLHSAGLTGQRENCQLLYLGGGTDRDDANALFRFKAGFSRHRALCRIGKHIHQPRVYEALRQKWLTCGAQAEKVLFYR